MPAILLMTGKWGLSDFVDTADRGKDDSDATDNAEEDDACFGTVIACGRRGEGRTNESALDDAPARRRSWSARIILF